jgi:hypothetical protein
VLAFQKGERFGPTASDLRASVKIQIERATNMTKKKSAPARRKSAQSERARLGAETHQTIDRASEALTTNHLSLLSADRRCLKTSFFARRFNISTMSAFLSALFMHAVRQHTVFLS